MHRPLLLTTVLLSLSANIFAAEPIMAYPKTQKVDQVDTYFGTKVEDPYRWLEDENSDKTKKWVQAENVVTSAYFAKIPYRNDVKNRLTELFNYPKYSAPFHRGQHYFFYKNDGLQNQSVLYVQEGIDGTPEVLLDPNTFSKDGTARLSAFDPSKDGLHAVYGISHGGSDWEEFHVIDVLKKQTLDETLKWIKFSNAGWVNDCFYYSRFDAPAPGQELVSSNKNEKIYFHKLGTAQEKDSLVFEDPAHPQRSHSVSTTRDERYVILEISDPSTGKKGNSAFYRLAASDDQTFKPLIPEIGEDEFGVIDNIGDQFLVQTNHKAPNSQVVLIDPKNPDESNWKTIIPQKPQTLTSATLGGNKLFTTYLKDVTSEVIVHDLDGKIENTVELPAIGTASGFGGLKEDTEVFYSFTSFIYPPSIFRYDLGTKKSTPFRTVPIPHFNADDYETTQTFYPSKDGTKIPLFLVHKKGLKMDGNNPTLLYAYGGFNITLNPAFSATRLSLLENGFVYAQANLRGGGEYGEKWHEAGTKLNKQNVFDDFLAAAQYLIDTKVTSPEHLSIQGGSNGGLLMGAVLNQRPDLFKAAIPQVGVMDMLRFQKFTVGFNWIPDYGSSDNEQQFKALYAYSPLHNIQTEKPYPAILVTTADHDDRVVPAHSFKYISTLQEKAHGGPFLIRIDTNSGHGASSVSKQLDEVADVQSFLFYNLGVTPR